MTTPPLSTRLDSLTCRQRPPVLIDPKPIGLVGAGNITRTHVPGYDWAGLETRAITDLDAAKARERAADLGIPVVADSLERLLEDVDIAFVDINFPGAGRLEAVARVAAAGRHILVQKPLADDWRTARDMVDICRKAGVVLAVNHNARFNPVYRTVRHVVASGVIGEPYFALHHLSASQDGMPHHGRWMTEAPRYRAVSFTGRPDLAALTEAYKVWSS